jgi:hypothetical protein
VTTPIATTSVTLNGTVWKIAGRSPTGVCFGHRLVPSARSPTGRGDPPTGVCFEIPHRGLFWAPAAPAMKRCRPLRVRIAAGHVRLRTTADKQSLHIMNPGGASPRAANHRARALTRKARRHRFWACKLATIVSSIPAHEAGRSGPE